MMSGDLPGHWKWGVPGVHKTCPGEPYKSNVVFRLINWWMNRSIDVLFWNACPPASDLNPAQERCQKRTMHVYFLWRGPGHWNKRGVPNWISKSSMPTFTDQSTFFMCFFNVQVSSSRVFFGATLHCHIQVLGLEIDQRPGQGAIGRNVWPGQPWKSGVDWVIPAMNQFATHID